MFLYLKISFPPPEKRNEKGEKFPVTPGGGVSSGRSQHRRGSSQNIQAEHTDQ